MHSEPSPISECSSQRCCKLRLKLLLHASGSTGKEDLKADRRVRHYKEVGLQEWPLSGRATIPRVLYGIGLSLCMSLRRRTFLSKSLRAPAPVDLTIHTFRTVDRTAGLGLPLLHGSGRGENLVTIARFVKPLFANMHHRVHAVAGAMRKLPACPHPDVSAGWPVWWWCDRRCVRSPQMPPFVDRTAFFSFALFAKNVAIDLKCIENHGGKPW